MKSVPLEELSLSSFVPLVGSTFRVSLDEATRVDLALAEAVSIRSASSGRRAGPGLAQETFSLVFEGPLAPQLGQGIFAFEHDGIGRFSLFIVPIARNEKAMQYQAVFNRLVAPPSN